MGFLIRSAFWLSLVLLFLPLGGGSDETGEFQTVGALDTLLAARDAAADMAGICERNPHVCETAKAAASTVIIRARAGLHMASEMMADDEQAENAAPVIAKDEAKRPQVTVTGSIAAPVDGESAIVRPYTPPVPDAPVKPAS